MTMIALGLGGLLLLLAAVFLLRRKKPSAVEPASLEPSRRRAVGEGLIAPQAEPVPLDEPARRPRALGLTPLGGDDMAGEESDDPEAYPEPVAEPEPELQPEAEPEDEVEEGEEQSLGAGFIIPRGVAPVDIMPDETPPEPEPDDAAPLVLMTKKKRADDGGSAPTSGYSAPTATVPSEVTETVSLILRRQVPVRDEAPRSWLGGLPMMPDSVDWPRAVAPGRADDGDVPLHFVAQIACEDLPAELWGGLGPRSGWLLYFLNPTDEEGDDPRLLRILHIDALGPERQPPADLASVFDEAGAGPDYRHCRAAEDIPSRWRRWPVDLVSVPNKAFSDGGRIIVAPADLADQLYDGEPVDPSRPDAEGEPPLSWRGALFVIDSVLRELGEGRVGPPPSAAQRELLARENYVASIIPELRAQEEVWLTEGPGAILSKEEPLREREREHKARIAPLAAARQQELVRVAAFIVQNPNADAIVARCEHDLAAEAEWRQASVAGLEAVRAQILENSLDTPLAPEDWAALQAHLEGERFTGWTIEWTSRNSEFPVSLVQKNVSLLDLADAGRRAAVIELAADYQADPSLRALVPDELARRLEPHWRSLTDGRPHRIGGFHDGIQSEPEPGPQEQLLMLQLASDDAMQWAWGDGGAYYAFLSPRDLAAGRFDKAEISLERP